MMIIAVDGTSGAGKGTICKEIAHHFDLLHIDSGLLYRTLAQKALLLGVSLDKSEEIVPLASTLTIEDLSESHLRDEEIGNSASKISVLPEVRTAINSLLHNICKGLTNSYKGCVIDGRDIGTIVFPNADIKIFVTADLDVRAKRISYEIAKKSQSQAVDLSQRVLERDQRDSTRKIAPLEKASDAYLLDTTNLTIEESCEKAIQYINNFLKN